MLMCARDATRCDAWRGVCACFMASVRAWFCVRACVRVCVRVCVRELELERVRGWVSGCAVCVHTRCARSLCMKRQPRTAAAAAAGVVGCRSLTDDSPHHCIPTTLSLDHMARAEACISLVQLWKSLGPPLPHALRMPGEAEHILAYPQPISSTSR